MRTQIAYNPSRALNAAVSDARTVLEVTDRTKQTIWVTMPPSHHDPMIKSLVADFAMLMNASLKDFQDLDTDDDRWSHEADGVEVIFTLDVPPRFDIVVVLGVGGNAPPASVAVEAGAAAHRCDARLAICLR